MNIKSYILGGAAVAALTSAGFVAPASAYTRHPGTPAEHRQTEDLNQQELNKVQMQEQATQQPGATASNQQAYAGQSSGMQQGATEPSSTAQTNMQDEESQNPSNATTANATPTPQPNPQSGEMANNASSSNEPQGGAQSDNQMANADSGANPQTGATASAEGSASANTGTDNTPGRQAMNNTGGAAAGQTPVDSLANPPQALANASVETSNGQAIGAVQRVITDASGKAKSVVVSLLGRVNKLVEIAANELSFDESRNVVVAQLSADGINALPPAPRG